MVVAERVDERHVLAVGVVQGACHRGHDRALFGLRLRRVGRVVLAVEKPWVDVEGHVDDVDADVGRVRQRIGHRGEEHEAAVLAALQSDQPDTGRHARDPKAVRFGRDDPGDVRAVAVVVDAHRIQTAGDLTRPVDRGDVRGKVARQAEVDLAVEVWVGDVDPRIEDPDEDPAIAGVDLTREVGADHRRGPTDRRRGGQGRPSSRRPASCPARCRVRWRPRWRRRRARGPSRVWPRGWSRSASRARPSRPRTTR